MLLRQQFLRITIGWGQFASISWRVKQSVGGLEGTAL